MKQYTLRIAHLESLPDRPVGSVVRRGNVIGRMGNTGSSTFNHCHKDLVKGYQTLMYRLKDIVFDRDTIRQLGLFIDNEFYDFEIVITTSFGDPAYLDKNGKWKMHPGFDTVPKNRHTDPGKNFDMHWNRSSTGILLAKDFDTGYGNYVMYGFED